MKAQQNRFKAALRDKRPQIGLWLALADSYSAEIIGGSGFDWLLIDGEHAPNDLRSMLHHLQVLAGSASHAVVRPPIGETYILKQLLDIGAQTILVPMVESAAQAQQMAASVKYPPAGVRGVGASLARASAFNRRTDYIGSADSEICLLLQVENIAGMENIDVIAGTEGVDGVFIGPADLAAAMGYPGNPGHSDVQRAIENGLERILAAGKAPGILTSDEQLARRYLKLGAIFVAVGTDVGLLARSTKALRDTYLSEALSDNSFASTARVQGDYA